MALLAEQLAIDFPGDLWGHNVDLEAWALALCSRGVTARPARPVSYGEPGFEEALCGLSNGDLRRACLNIGFDLECGLCASRFWTGGDQAEVHCPTCRTEHRK